MRVVVLGCGYVGLELGRYLEERGHEVVGVRRSSDGIDAIQQAGFEGIRADVTEPNGLERVPAADAVVYAASSGGRGAGNARDVYVSGLRTAIEVMADREEPPDRLIYTSSTGVYGDHGGAWVDESTSLDPRTDRQRVLVEAEEVALSGRQHGIDATVARLAGVYGPERYGLERYLEGPVPEGWRNIVHRDDAAGAVGFLLETGQARNEVVLVVDNEPVSKHDFADWLAEECGVDPPPKQSREERQASQGGDRRGSRRGAASKRCSNEKLRGLGYPLTFPTYREGYRAAIQAYCPE